MYLLLNGFRGDWSVDFNELRTVLDCTAKRYEEVKFFNSEVVKKAVAEVNEKTDINVEYTTEKSGRRVTGFKFKIRKAIQASEPVPIEEKYDEDDLDDPVALSASALPPELTRNEVLVLRDLAIKNMPFESLSGIADRELWLYEYFRSKTLLMMADGDVKKPYAWLKGAVSKDWH